MPLDPIYPEERIKYIIEDSKTSIIITRKEYQLTFLDNNHFKKINIDVILEQNIKIETIETIKDPKNLVYIIYTSGSTGKPKGIEITNANLNSFIKSIFKAIPFKKHDKWLS